MDKIKCFWIEPTDQVLRSLRRLTFPNRKACPSGSGHQASVEIGQCGAAESPKLYKGQPVHGDLWTHGDLRWPSHCTKCGYEFVETDEWQFNPNVLYRRTDTGELMTSQQAPAGAMRHASWMDSFACHVDADGIFLQVKLPDGIWWDVDGPASNGAPGSTGWTRTGVVPEITARPSIATPGYHGFLTDGYLVKC